MFERKFLVPAGVASLGVYIVVAANLPSRGSFTFDGPVEYFFKSRVGWDTAFVVAVGVFLFLLGLCGLMKSLRHGESAGV